MTDIDKLEWHGVHSGEGFVSNLTVKTPDGIGKTLFRKMKSPDVVESITVLLEDGSEKVYLPSDLEIVEPAPIPKK